MYVAVADVENTFYYRHIHKGDKICAGTHFAAQKAVSVSNSFLFLSRIMDNTHARTHTHT